MKNFILITLFAAILSAGCSKEKEESTFFVKFMVGNTQKSFTGHTFGHVETSGGYTSVQMLGAHGPTSDDNYMGIYIDNSPGQLPITTGIYEDNSTNFTVLGTYAINNVESYGGQTVSDHVVQYNISGHNRMKVTITEITSTNIRGTFSGDFYETGDVENGTKIQITNGEFNVQVK